MDQCFLSKKYPKTFLISSKLITTKPPVFISDMLNRSCLQFLELHRSQKWEGGAERGVTPPLTWEWAVTPRPRSLPSPPLGQLHPLILTACAHYSSFFPTYSPVFSLSWFDPSWACLFPTARVSQSLSLKAFPACPSSEHKLPAARGGHGFLHTGVHYS